MGGYQFHEGKLALQKRFNATHDLKKVERVYCVDSIVNTAVSFIKNQTTVILSVYDDNIWASILIGEVGFLK